MPTKVFLNVILSDTTEIDALIDQIKNLSHVDRVIKVSKVMPNYVAEGGYTDPGTTPIDLVVYISARRCSDALKTVLRIRDISDTIRSTVTSFGFPDYASSRAGTKTARGRK